MSIVGGDTSFIHFNLKSLSNVRLHTGIQRCKRMLWAGISAAVGKLSFCWNHETLKEATRMLLYVLPELRRSVTKKKKKKVPQKAASQTSFSCLKSQDLSANRGCPLTGCAIYHLAGISRDLTNVAECKYKSESTLTNMPHLTTLSCHQLT